MQRRGLDEVRNPSAECGERAAPNPSAEVTYAGPEIRMQSPRISLSLLPVPPARDFLEPVIVVHEPQGESLVDE